MGLCAHLEVEFSEVSGLWHCTDCQHEFVSIASIAELQEGLTTAADGWHEAQKRIAALEAKLAAAEEEATPYRDAMQSLLKQREGCTGLGATWCPIHGDCICREGLADGDEYCEEINPECPLCGNSTKHGEETLPADAAEAVLKKLAAVEEENGRRCPVCESSKSERDDHRQAEFDLRGDENA